MTHINWFSQACKEIFDSDHTVIVDLGINYSTNTTPHPTALIGKKFSGLKTAPFFSAVRLGTNQTSRRKCHEKYCHKCRFSITHRELRILLNVNSVGMLVGNRDF
jgi:hypothetical protein